ncbi:MAG: glycosyltransferase family 39 protein, partial [Candidatus Omnitrophota bacterium]
HAVAYSNWDFNPHFFKIPPLLSYVLFPVYGLIYLMFKAALHFTAVDFARLFLEDPSIFYLSGRMLFGVVLGTASVWVLYRIGDLIAGSKVGKLAAFLLAVNFLHVRDSHYLYADIPMIFAMLCALFFAVKYTVNRSGRGWLTASVWAGIAIAFKYIAAPIGIAVIWAAGRVAGEGLAFKWNYRRAAAAAAGCAAVFVLLNPFAVLDPAYFLRELRTQAQAESSVGVWHHAIYSLLEGGGTWLLLAGFAGLIAAWKKNRLFSFFWSFPFIYYGMICLFSQPYERYAMPIVPFMCLGAAHAVNAMAGRFKSDPMRSAVLFCLVIVISIAPITKSLQLDCLTLNADTRTLAKDWVEKRLPAGSGIVLEHGAFSPRLWQTSEQIRQKSAELKATDPYASSKTKKLDLLAKIAESKITYRVYFLNEKGRERAVFGSASPGIDADLGAFERSGVRYYVRYRHPGQSRFFEDRLASRARPLAVFSPYRNTDKINTQDEWANVALPFRSSELFSRVRPGPYLEIYEIVNR